MEILVALTIFSVIMLLVMGIFEMVTEGQRNVIAAQNVQENMRFIMEIISKEVRTAQKDEVDALGQCPNVANGKVYSVNGLNDELYFRNHEDQCVAYRLNNGRFEIERNAVGAPPSSAYIGFITPDEIRVSNLRFNIVYDNVSTDQSMVVMSMDINAVGKEMHAQNIKLQTAISSRYYE